MCDFLPINWDLAVIKWWEGFQYSSTPVVDVFEGEYTFQWMDLCLDEVQVTLDDGLSLLEEFIFPYNFGLLGFIWPGSWQLIDVFLNVLNFFRSEG